MESKPVGDLTKACGYLLIRTARIVTRRIGGPVGAGGTDVARDVFVRRTERGVTCGVRSGIRPAKYQEPYKNAQTTYGISTDP